MVEVESVESEVERENRCLLPILRHPLFFSRAREMGRTPKATLARLSPAALKAKTKKSTCSGRHSLVRRALSTPKSRQRQDKARTGARSAVFQFWDLAAYLPTYLPTASTRASPATPVTPRSHRTRHFVLSPEKRGGVPKETRMIAAVGEYNKVLKSGEKPNVSAIARDHKVPPRTLHDRVHQKHKAANVAQEKNQLLTVEQEEVLIEWCQQRGFAGMPWTEADLSSMASTLHGEDPGRDWASRFRARHADRISGSRANALDPTRAQAFNEASATAHFKSWDDVRTRYEIPVENIYNMDEKGIQLGGGRKNSQRKYLFAKTDSEKYRAKSGDLELVTIVEATCADGTDAVPPSFVTKPGSVGSWWKRPPSEIGM